MKLSCAITTPEVTREALAVFTGDFEQKLAKAEALGYNGVELMRRDPSKLNVDDRGDVSYRAPSVCRNHCKVAGRVDQARARIPRYVGTDRY